MKKVLVTGASGFLGSHISEAAHEAGYEVHALIRAKSSRQWLNHDWIKIHVSELENRRRLPRILGGMDAVIHSAAALIGASEEELGRVNVRATRILAEEACKAGVKRFIFVSSRAAGGPGATLEPKKETDPDCPLSAYGRSKKQAEEMLFQFRDRIKVVSLRYAIIYGPRDRHLVRLFRLINSPLVPLIGTKPIYLPMVYVEDAAGAAVAALQADAASGSFYYISDGIPYTMDVMYDRIAYALGKEFRFLRIPVWLGSLLMGVIYGGRKKEVAFTPGAVREFRYRFRLTSIDKAGEELDWQPQVMLHEGLVETVRWYKEQGWL